MTKTTYIGVIETIIGVCLAVQALPKEAWQDPKVWVTAILLAAAKTARDFVAADK